MSLPGQQPINIGLPNESVGSDSLYTAFTKTQQNFTTLFSCASPYSTFYAGAGINVAANSVSGIVTITNTGVTNLVAGTNIVLSSANGNVTISAVGGNGGSGTVTSVGLIATTRLTVTGSPIISSGNINIDLASSGVVAGTYTNANLTIDQYGRITTAANGISGGTVSSVGITPGAGIQVNGGPITSNGNITITNIGVTQLTAGTGIALSGGNGNVTISASALGGTVTSVGVSSGQLVVTNSPVVAAGTIGIDLPSSATFSGNLTTGNLTVNGLINFQSTYGSFFSNANVTNSVGNTAMVMGFNNSLGSNNVSVTGNSNSQLTLAKTGTYSIRLNGQASKANSGADTAYVWLAKNGTIVNNSSTVIGLLGNGVIQPFSWSWTETANVSDYYEINWSSNATDAQFTYSGTKTSPTRPASPSITVSVTSVGP